MKQRFLRFLADLRFSITILLIIAVFSIIGTIIEQDQSIETYKLNYPLTEKVFGFLSWDIILYFGFDHTYKTWWFISCIVTFGLSLFSCTILQQFPALKIARRCQFFRMSNQFKKLKICARLRNSKFHKLLFQIRRTNYSLFHQKNIIYAYKGLMGKIAPLIVHFSMILVLAGTLVGAITGFRAQEIIPKTETFHIQNVLNSGSFSTIPKVLSRVNDFWIIYNSDNSIVQFYSDISVLDTDGNEINRKTIFVNSPIQYKGVNYYQTDWNLISLRLEDRNSQILQYPLIKLLNSKTRLWITWVPIDKNLDQGLILLIDNLQGYYSVYTESGKFLGNLETNEVLRNHFSIALIDTVTTTGLQIKTDPGIPIIYLGFFSLILSTFISYITYSQIWVVKDKKLIFVGGNTTRAFFDFEIEFFKLVKV